MLAESVVWELCRSGALDRNIAFVKGALRDRRDALVEALSDYLSESGFVLPGGGYFLWLTLNDDVNCDELLAAALQESGRVHRRLRLHAGGRPVEPSPVVRERPRRPDLRGRRAHRHRARRASGPSPA